MVLLYTKAISQGWSVSTIGMVGLLSIGLQPHWGLFSPPSLGVCAASVQTLRHMDLRFGFKVDVGILACFGDICWATLPPPGSKKVAEGCLAFRR